MSKLEPLPELRRTIDGDDDPGRRLVNWMFPAYVALILLGIIVFRLKSSMPGGNEMSVDRAVLAAVDAATLTGFQQRDSTSLYKPQAQYMLLLLTVGGSMFSMVGGSLAVVRILRLPYKDKQVVLAAVACEAVAMFVGATGLYGYGGTTLGGMTQGAGAFGNSGAILGSPPGLFDGQTWLIVLPMMLLGGLGLPVLMELWDYLRGGRGLSTHSRVTLGMSAWAYLIAIAAFVLLQWVALNYTRDPDKMRGVWASSSAAALNCRSGGIAFGFKFARELPRTMQWAMIVAMAVGAGSAGTAGGLKLGTVYTIARGIRRLLAGERAGRSVGIAVCWLGTYCGIALLGLLMLLNTEPQTGGDELLFTAVSALSNVGLSRDVLSTSVRGSYIICALMLAGRMVPLLILWWMADTTPDADVAIG